MTGATPPRGPHFGTNRCSAKWYGIFLDSIAAEQTNREAAFVARHLPLPRYRRIIDLCCGSGRHARALAALGYDVTGVDVNEAALAKAEQHDGPVRYVRADMRYLGIVDEVAAAVICMWQSFGYFDDRVNADILRQMATTVVPGGRIFLDVYNREFFASRTGVRTLMRGTEPVEEISRLVDGRLTVDLRYLDASTERHEWQLYKPDELESMGSSVGLRLLESHAAFDESRVPGEDLARMQLLFERC